MAAAAIEKRTTARAHLVPPWGHCQHCRYFGSPARMPLAAEEALCRQPELARYELEVFGAGGCRRFEMRAGLEQTAE